MRDDTRQTTAEVEEKILQGRTRLEQRKGATDEELKTSRPDILLGTLFSNLMMYFIILSTAATLRPLPTRSRRWSGRGSCRASRRRRCC